MATYNLVIIGSGSGGARAAELAARRGARVLLIEKHLFGGTCLHSGCVPLSLLAKSARRWRDWKIDPSQQVERPVSLLADWVSGTRRRIARQSTRMFDHLRSLRIEIEAAHARLLGKGRVLVDRGNGDSEVVETENVIIATGASPAVSHFPGRLDPTGMLHSCEEPRDLLIVGGGHIGCEFAGIFNAIGTRVTILEKCDRLLPELDPEVGAYMRALFEARGIKVQVKVDASDAILTPASAPNGPAPAPASDSGEKILWATGRIPNVQDLGLETVGVRVEKTIVVDSLLRTTARNIFAIGDVTGLDGLATGARAQAQIAVENAFGASNRYDPAGVARCYWTQPAVATVGLQEREAIAAGHAVRVGRAQPRNRAIQHGESDDQAVGFVKLVTDANTGLLLGGVLIGDHAGDLINVISMALKFGARADDLCTNLISPALADALAECQNQLA